MGAAPVGWVVDEWMVRDGEGDGGREVGRGVEGVDRQGSGGGVAFKAEGGLLGRGAVADGVIGVGRVGDLARRLVDDVRVVAALALDGVAADGHDGVLGSGEGELRLHASGCLRHGPRAVVVVARAGAGVAAVATLLGGRVGDRRAED